MVILDFSNYFQRPKLTGRFTLYRVIMVLLQQFQLKGIPGLMRRLMVQKLWIDPDAIQRRIPHAHET